MTCPACHGSRVTRVVACSTTGCREHDEVCRTCEGTGEMPADLAAQLQEGERRRQDRIARGLSLREEARRLEISATDLSDMEHGRMAFPEDA